MGLHSLFEQLLLLFAKGMSEISNPFLRPLSLVFFSFITIEIFPGRISESNIVIRDNRHDIKFFGLNIEWRIIVTLRFCAFLVFGDQTFHIDFGRHLYILAPQAKPNTFGFLRDHCMIIKILLKHLIL